MRIPQSQFSRSSLKSDLKEGRESWPRNTAREDKKDNQLHVHFKRHRCALSLVPFLSPSSLQSSPVPHPSQPDLFKERNRETVQDVVQLSVVRPDDSSSSRSWAEFHSIDRSSFNKVHWHIHIMVYAIPHIAHWTSAVKSVTSITVMTVHLKTQGTCSNG